MKCTNIKWIMSFYKCIYLVTPTLPSPQRKFLHNPPSHSLPHPLGAAILLILFPL